MRGLAAWLVGLGWLGACGALRLAGLAEPRQLLDDTYARLRDRLSAPLAEVPPPSRIALDAPGTRLA